MGMKPEDVPAEVVTKIETAVSLLPGWVLGEPDTAALHVVAAVIPEIQALALREFADGLPAGWKRPNGPADAARAHAAHLLECTCPADACRTATTGEPTDGA